MSSILGSCHCGRVKWESIGDIETVVRCYCSICRKTQGGDYGVWVVVPAKGFSILEGADHINKYEGTNVSSKKYCSVCGTTVHCTNGNHYPGYMLLARGTIDEGNELSTKIQVYTQHKYEWIDVLKDSPAVF